jgi:hypothetical protein
MGSHYDFVHSLELFGEQVQEAITNAKLCWEHDSYHCNYLNAGLRQCTYPNHAGIQCTCDTCPLMLGLQ